MTGGAVSLIVTAVATLGADLGAQGVELEKIIPMAARHVVAPVIARGQLGIDPAAGVAIQAEGLGVALVTVAGSPHRRQAMLLQPVCIMIRAGSLRLMAIFALGGRHAFEVLVGLLLGSRLRYG